jgi:hypothetical protein
MLQNSMWMLNQPQVKDWQPGGNDAPFRIAVARYRQAQRRARLERLAALLLGHANRLLHLGSVEANANLRGGRYAGLRSVPINQIRGSEGRCDDFDADFCPLKSHNRSRWLGLAAAWQRGAVLPPVELIQVGEVYFVRDGHHRISVARAFGQEQIDAEVTAWDVAGPLPWERQGATGQVVCQPA